MVTKWATSAAVIPNSKFPGKMLNRFIILICILDETIYVFWKSRLLTGLSGSPFRVFIFELNKQFLTAA